MKKILRMHAIPPAGNRLGSWFLRGMTAGHETSLSDAASEYFNNRNVLSVSSGRTALWLALRTMSSLEPKRRKVILPAYTCPAVASAVLAAHLHPVLVDVEPNGFGYCLPDLSREVNDDVLAVIVVHLFGHPVSMAGVEDLCHRRGAFVIEDAAQGFGNSFDGPDGDLLGTRGDASFFSFGRGKTLSMLHGGLFLTRSDRLFRGAMKIHGEMEPFPAAAYLKLVLSLFAYCLFSVPRLYWVAQMLPFLHIGETIFEPRLQLNQGSNRMAGLFRVLLSRLEGERRERRSTSGWYLRHLSELDLPYTSLGKAYPYVRYPVTIGRKDLRDEMLSALRTIGAGASRLYPCPLNELPVLAEVLRDPREYPNARFLSNAIVTLPVHSGVSDEVKERILGVFAEKQVALRPVNMKKRSMEAAS